MKRIKPTNYNKLSDMDKMTIFKLKEIATDEEISNIYNIEKSKINQVISLIRKRIENGDYSKIELSIGFKIEISKDILEKLEVVRYKKKIKIKELEMIEIQKKEKYYLDPTYKIVGEH